MIGGDGGDGGVPPNLNPHRDNELLRGRTTVRVLGQLVYGTPPSTSMNKRSALVDTQSRKAQRLESAATAEEPELEGYWLDGGSPGRTRPSSDLSRPPSGWVPPARPPTANPFDGHDWYELNHVPTLQQLAARSLHFTGSAYPRHGPRAPDAPPLNVPPLVYLAQQAVADFWGLTPPREDPGGRYGVLPWEARRNNRDDNTDF